MYFSIFICLLFRFGTIIPDQMCTICLLEADICRFEEGAIWSVFALSVHLFIYMLYDLCIAWTNSGLFCTQLTGHNLVS
jgi:hypothetical protein